jgi:hypothetical protein
VNGSFEWSYRFCLRCIWLGMTWCSPGARVGMPTQIAWREQAEEQDKGMRQVKARPSHAEMLDAEEIGFKKSLRMMALIICPAHYSRAAQARRTGQAPASLSPHFRSRS